MLKLYNMHPEPVNTAFGGLWGGPNAPDSSKSREIPVRHDLEQMVFEYFDAAGLRTARKDTPLFRTAFKKTGQLTKNALHVIDICRMVKRRLKDAGLPVRLSPHSFRVTTITDLLEQGAARRRAAPGRHADPRTTRLYDRRDKKITRNIVERISDLKEPK